MSVRPITDRFPLISFVSSYNTSSISSFTISFSLKCRGPGPWTQKPLCGLTRLSASRGQAFESVHVGIRRSLLSRAVGWAVTTSGMPQLRSCSSVVLRWPMQCSEAPHRTLLVCFCGQLAGARAANEVVIPAPQVANGIVKWPVSAYNSAWFHRHGLHLLNVPCVPSGRCSSMESRFVWACRSMGRAGARLCKHTLNELTLKCSTGGL